MAASFAGVFGCVVLVAQICGLFVFWSYRHAYPIRFKRPLLCLLAPLPIMMTLIYPTLDQLRNGEGEWCPLYQLISMISVGFNMSIFIIRVFNLHISHLIMQHSMALKADASPLKPLITTSANRGGGSLRLRSINDDLLSTETQISKTSRLIERRAFLVTNSFSIRILLTELVWCVVILLLKILLEPEFIHKWSVQNSTCRMQRGGDIIWIYMLGSGTLKIVLGVIVLFKTRVAVDSVGLKRELQLSLFCSFVSGAVFGSGLHIRLGIPAYYLVLVSVSVHYFITIVRPIIQAIRNISHHHHLENQIVHPTLTNYTNKPSSNKATGPCNKPVERLIVSSKRNRDLFARFLQKEFALENLTFWEHVIRFRADFLRFRGRVCNVHFWSRALMIYRQHLQHHSPLQVNLSSSMFIEFKTLFADLDVPSMPSDPQVLKTVQPDMFEHAREAIGKLMNDGPFPRFLHSDPAHYQAWDELVLAEQQEQALLQSYQLNSSTGGGQTSVRGNTPNSKDNTIDLSGAIDSQNNCIK